MFFEAYPIIFQGIYKLSAGIAGLAYLFSKLPSKQLRKTQSYAHTVAAGGLVGFIASLYYDSFLLQAKARNRPWASIEEYRRLPLACIGGPLCVLSLFWLGWTSSPNVPWIVPMLAGIPFGLGFFFIFNALLNYVMDAYKTLSASAMAAISCCRSTGSCLLPLVAKPLYNKLGVAWATSCLGFLAFVMCLIPFAFIRYGQRIRAGSKLCQALEREQQELLGTEISPLTSPVAGESVVEV